MGNCTLTVADVSEPGDIAIGTISLLSSALGLPANIAAFTYFYTLKPRNPNGLYFQRVYTIITAVDCLICAVQFPVIEAFFKQRIEDELIFFKDAYFCHVWFIIFYTAMVTSVCLVGVLSVSRTFILVYPTKQLPFKASWVVPGVMAALSVTVLSATAATPSFTTFFSYLYGVAWTASTELVLLINTYNYTGLAQDPNDVIQETQIAFAVGSCLSSSSIVPIAISFIISMVYLQRAKDRATSTNASTVEHEAASLTIIIVTCLYVMCSLPAFVYVFYSFIILTGYSDTFDNDTSVLEILCFLFPTYLEKYYMWLIFGLPPAINSALNPVIYFWRMASFRSFVLQLHVRALNQQVHPEIDETEEQPV